MNAVRRRLVTGLAALLFTAVVVAAVADARSGAHAPPGPALPTKQPAAPGPGARVQHFPRSKALYRQGASLYQQDCASCHGTRLWGERGIAPELRTVGAGPLDFYLSTGRMPLQDPHVEPLRTSPLLTRPQMNALIDYVSSFGGPPAPAVDPGRGSLSLGFQLFTEHCAGCHQIVGRGGLTVGADVPNLQAAGAQQIAEAVRMGPYLMPRFTAREIDQHQLDSIARYVLWTRKPDNAGGWGIDNIGPIPEGIVAWLLGIAALVIVARLIGERAQDA